MTTRHGRGLAPALNVAITQRRIRDSRTGSERDALDDAWSQWFGTVLPLANVIRLPNAPEQCASILERAGIAALVLSGGEDVGSSELRDATERVALDYASAHGLPVVGVCRGMQFLQIATGGTLCRVEGHVAIAHSVQRPAGAHHEPARDDSPSPWHHPLHARIDRPVEVNSWHRWGIRETADEWRVLARAHDDTIEAFVHSERRWLGVMSHPERTGGEVASHWVRHVLLSSSGAAGA